MADSETTVPAGEQATEENGTTSQNCQEEAPAESNDSQPEGQVEEGQATEESGGQEANADSNEPADQADGADVNGETSGGDDAGATQEQAAVEESTDQVDGEPAQENNAEPETEPQQESESEAKPEVASEQEAQPELSAEPETQPEPEQQAETEDTKEEEKPAAELCEEEKARCRRNFDRRAVDGRIDLKGFKMLFRLMGQVLSAQDAESMFDEGNRDEKGTIDCDEFCRLYAKFHEAEQTRKEVLMNSIDKLFPNSDGQPVELKKVEGLLMKLQQPDLDMRLVREKSDLNAYDVRNMVKSMDKHGNGYISKQEFVETLTKHLDTGA